MPGGGQDEARPAALPFASRRLLSLVWTAHRLPPLVVFTVGLLLLPLVAAADHATGLAYSFSIFYLVVVVAVSATGSSGHALAVAVLAAVTWTGVDALTRPSSHPVVSSVWNGLARFAVFYVCATLVAAVVVMARDERATSRSDPLTGLLNRRGFHDLAGIELARTRRSGTATTLLYLDIDGFKPVNDVRGHAAGDRLLGDVAERLSARARRTDVVARIGGDEFVCLLPATDGQAALVAARRAREALDEMCRQEGWPVRFSIGAVTFASPPASVDELLAAGDRLMYDAKREGRRTAQSTVAAHVAPGAESELDRRRRRPHRAPDDTGFSGLAAP